MGMCDRLNRRFTLKPEHLKLMARLNFYYEKDYYDGAPAVDAKRPFGNSAWHGDIAEMLGLPEPDYDTASDEEIERFQDSVQHWLEDMVPALEIVTQTQSFIPGEYFSEFPGPWKLVNRHDAV